MIKAFAMSTPTARTSAASSKSEFVMDPFGLESETTSWAISNGKANRHTTGGIACTNENRLKRF
jgi:hypothetical protein